MSDDEAVQLVLDLHRKEVRADTNRDLAAAHIVQRLPNCLM
jgi:hypothetical protein